MRMLVHQILIVLICKTSRGGVSSREHKWSTIATYKLSGSMPMAKNVDAVVIATERAKSVLKREHHQFE